MRLAFALWLAPALAAGQGYQGTVTPGPDALLRNPELAKVKVEQRLGLPVGDADVTTDDGRRVGFQSLLATDRPTIILPIFYRCTGVCQLELAGVVAALAGMPDWRVGKDVRVVALGLHPRETFDLARAKKKEMLRTYGGKGAEADFVFTVGRTEDVTAITRSLGFVWNYDAERDRVNHPSGIMIVTPKGIISSYILGTNYERRNFTKLLEIAKKEEQGQRTEEIFFGCVHLDPVTGERSIQIKNVLKVLGIATVGSIVLSILVMAGRVTLRRRLR